MGPNDSAAGGHARSGGTRSGTAAPPRTYTQQVDLDTGRMRLTAVAAGVAALIAGIGVLYVAGTTGTEPGDAPPVTAPALALADPATVYDPVKAGEPLPASYRQLLDRDQIEPVYDPVFVPGGQVDWPDSMLVIGVAAADTAKAYPVTHLNKHEMVIDSLDGDPILVSW